MDLRPDIGDRVELRDHADREHPSRVEEFGNGLLVVTRPRGLPRDEVFGVGTLLRLVWAHSDGVAVLPVRVIAEHPDGPGLWSLLVTGPAEIEQRRRAARVPTSGPVLLRPGKGDKSDPVKGSLIEVSESAVRCAVAAGAADRFLTSRNQVTAQFRVGEIDFAVPGVVEFLRPSKRPAELEEIVVLFDQPVKAADALREALAAQSGGEGADAESDGAGDTAGDTDS